MQTSRCYGCMKIKEQEPVCEHCGFDNRRANAQHQLPQGTILRGQYRVGRVLGQGGFGITYMGWDINLDIPVAIKEYYPSGVVSRDIAYGHNVKVSNSEMEHLFNANRERFLREARTLARLEDVPEVVQVKNFFADNNTAYIVMAYVRGITLKEHIRNSGGKLTVNETLQLLTPLMRALEQVHSVGLVHRDISPDNIMLQHNGKLRLIDFGAAHASTTDGDKSTQAVLKYGFAPIEQYQSKGNLGPWTDVYAMCATIYCCLTGLQPSNVTDRMMGEDDFRWRAIPDMSESQKEILKRGLELQYTKRTQSMRGLCEGLLKNTGYSPDKKSLPQTMSPSGTIPLRKNSWELMDEKTGHSRVAIHTAPLERNVHHAINGVAELDDHKTNRKTRRNKGVLLSAISAAAVTLVVVLGFMLKNQFQSPGSRTFENHGFSNYVFGTDVRRNMVRSVVFKDTTQGAGENAIDYSDVQDGSVLVWTIKNEGLYDLYVAAEGGVVAPENCAQMFREFTNLRHVDFTGLDTKNVTNMKLLFYGCENLIELDMSGLDTSSVANMNALFYGCSGLKNLVLTGMDTGNVTDMSKMFYNCSNLRELTLTGINTGKVENMQEMFFGCGRLKTLDISGIDTSNVTNMSLMFYACSNLTNLKMADLNTANVTDMSSMFLGCSSLNRLDMSDFDTENVTDMGGMFSGCSSLTSLDITEFNTRKVENMSAMFMDCTKLSALDVSGLETGYVSDMSHMFSGCSNLKKLDISKFDTSSVTNMNSMFYGCAGLSQLDFSRFDTRQVTDMRGLFYGCAGLTRVNLRSFDTGRVTDMAGMFFGCSNLVQLDLSNFNTSKVTDMNSMFLSCSNLANVDVSGFDTSKVRNMRAMFYGTAKLKNVQGNFDVSNVSNHSGFMDTGDTFNGRKWERLFQ